MGNICSATQKACKDAESESEGAENGCQENEHKPQTPDDDRDKNNIHNTGLINTPATNKIENTDVHDSVADVPQSDCDEMEVKNSLSIYSKACGSPISSRNIEHNRKVVIYILMSCKREYKQQLNAICKLFPNIWTHCKVKGFELTASFTHHEILNRNEKDCDEPPDDDNFIENLTEIHAVHDEVTNFLAEISRHSNSHILPILFLGSTLGRMCIPIKIEEKDFKFLLSNATKEQCDLLHKFYNLDNLSQPACYSLVKNSTLKKEDTEQILVTLITLMPINLKDFYLASAVEQEIIHALIKTKELAKRCLWIQSGNEPTTSPHNSVIQEEISRRLLNIHSLLRNEIPVKNIIRTFPSVDEQEELDELLDSALKTSLDSIIAEHLGKLHSSRNTLGMCRQIAEEIEAVKRHTIAIATNCTNHNSCDAISRYIRSDSLFPLTIFGKPGEGKSNLTAEIALQLENWVENPHLVLRYASLTVLSSEITSLLASIAEQISILVSGEPSPTQHSVLEYKGSIERLLESSKIFLVIIIDSIDKVIGVADFSWLPKISKPNTKIILTVTGNEDLQENWASQDLIKRGIPKDNLISLHSCSKNLLKNDKHLHTNEKRLGSQVDIFENNPFEAKIISKLSHLGVNIRNSNSETYIEKLFIAFEAKIDANLLEILLVIISISTYGIYETDCVNILREQTKLDKICSLIIWSKFCWIVGPMLLHTDKIKIMDIAFKEAILKRYCKNVLGIQKVTKSYFESQPDSFHDVEKNKRSANADKFLKVPHYDLAITITECEGQSILEQYFSKHYFRDLSWMLKKISATGCFEYLNDILIAEGLTKTTSVGSQHIKILKDFLTLHMSQLNCDGSQFYTLFKIFLRSSISTDAALDNNSYVKEWTNTIDQLKIPYLERLNEHNPEPSNNEKETYNDVVSLKGPGQLIAAMNTEGDEICVWDVPSCKRIRILKCVPQPSLLCPIRDFEAAVLCKREIKVIDLKEGQYKATLKGVMNQRMPYFGLHDENHLVCLSRNRMYVNLMNLQSGDCVTSFKAGEDRFLNSLIVSGNGRILVCGDESQKPFSLLVWHLSQRRLLYDLRIPHHDLFTSLSAITYEGSYVSVVAKEIRESGPNFIVVYDLQSGTLFQKLKPVCNTVAIAISQANGCVIAGLENAEILIWDLVTGNCRHTLIGHNAPVTLLKLDPQGSCLLSGDKEGRDLSLRLWELGTGNPLAVFSPPQKTSSCEILDNGQFIILALENISEVLILRLRNYDKAQMQSEQYVNEITDCKTYTLSEN